MENVISMKSMRRTELLKFYVGCSCMITDPTRIDQGVLENVDLEDDSCLVKLETRSIWIEGKYVQPAVKTFKEMDTDDLNTLLNHVVIGKRERKCEHFIVTRRQPEFITLAYNDGRQQFDLIINDGFSVVTSNALAVQPIDNNALIVVLMLRLGYDVTGQLQ